MQKKEFSLDNLVLCLIPMPLASPNPRDYVAVWKAVLKCASSCLKKQKVPAGEFHVCTIHKKIFGFNISNLKGSSQLSRDLHSPKTVDLARGHSTRDVPKIQLK